MHKYVPISLRDSLDIFSTSPLNEVTVRLNVQNEKLIKTELCRLEWTT